MALANSIPLFSVPPAKARGNLMAQYSVSFWLKPSFLFLISVFLQMDDE